MPIAPALPSYINNIIQSNYLERRFLKALRPKSRYRPEANREISPQEAGQSVTQTRKGLIQPTISKIPAGGAPPVVGYTIEQWTVFIDRYGSSMPTNLTGSAVAITNKFLQDIESLAQHAGWSCDRASRNALFAPYIGGQTFATAASTSSVQLLVASLSGFRFATDTNGKPQPVSASNPLTVTVNAVANTVVGAVPANNDYPDGPGYLVLGTAVSASLRDRVLAANRPFLSLPSGATSVDSITGSHVFSFAQTLAARQRLVDDRVPQFEDGLYHVHLTPAHATALLQDAHFKTLTQGRFDAEALRQGVILEQFGMKFMENNDSPNAANISAGTAASGNSAVASYELGGEINNSAGVALNYSIMLGAGALRELYFPDSRIRAQGDGRVAQFGYVGAFQSTETADLVAEMEGITLVIRPPLDEYGEVLTSSWKLDAGWVAPSDERSTTSAARYKRAVALVSA